MVFSFILFLKGYHYLIFSVQFSVANPPKPLSAFDDDLFEAIGRKKVVIRSKTEFEVYFESGEVVKSITFSSITLCFLTIMLSRGVNPRLVQEYLVA